MMTRLAVPGKCGALGASGLSAAPAVSRASSSLSSAGNMLEPSARDRIIWRRFISISPLIECQKFVTAEQHAHQAGPGLAVLLVLGDGRVVKSGPRRSQELAGIASLVG